MSSKNQLFLVIQEIKQCRWIYFENQEEGGIDPGCVAIIRPCHDGNEFEVHRGTGVWRTPVLVTREGGLPRDKVRAITDQEFDLLLGTQLRVELHSSGRLKWACQLKVGDEVQVKLDVIEPTVAGVIRGTATTRAGTIDYGLQFIVEITEESFEYFFGDKGKAETKLLCMKHCAIIVPANYLYPPEQSKTLTRKAATIEETEAAAVEVKVKPPLSMTQLSRKPSLKESLQQIGQQCEEMEKRIEELEDQVSNLTSENAEKEQVMHQLNEQIQNLESEFQEKVALINQQQEQLSTNEAEIEKFHNELREKQEEIDTIKEESEQQLRDQQQQHEQALAEIRQQNERILGELREHHQQEENRHQQEQDQLRQRIARLQQELQEMTDQKQQLQARVETAFAYMRGDPGTSQVGFDAIELWEIPREDVHVSNKILGTGGWGYVAEGTFRGQKVAVKCLHRGILSQFTTNHVRREISIMAQVRHPNLVLLIGAVLNADTGPLIITELLDQSLRSAYQEHLLEEHYKLPIMQDVAAALSYLHSHRRPIIHRDVSSSNILLDTVRSNAIWRAKLSDFGSANLIRLATTPAEGAVTYAAPEVRTEARNQQTPKVDVYSFGVLLCEISLCRLPPDPSEFAAFLGSVWDNADPRLYELAQNCTKRGPEERPSMRDVLTQISQLIPVE